MTDQLHAVLVAIAVSIIGLLNTAILSPTMEASILPSDVTKFLQMDPILRPVLVASFSFSAAVSGILVSRFGPQVVSLVGAVVITVGLLTTVIISSDAKATITFGVVTGIGCGLVYVSIYEAVKLTYKAYRNFVYGVLGCVSYTGYFLGPHILNMLMTFYPTRGSIMIMSGISMHIIPLSLLLPGGSWQQQLTDWALPEVPVSFRRRNRPFRRRDKQGVNGLTNRQEHPSEDLETLWEPSDPQRTSVITEESFKQKLVKTLRKTGLYALLFAGVVYAYGASVVLGVTENYTTQRYFSVIINTDILFIISGAALCVLTLFQGIVIGRVDPLYWFIGFACGGGLLTFIFMIPVPAIAIYVYVGLIGLSMAGTGREIICPVIMNLVGTDNFAFPFGIYVCLTSLARLLGCPLTSVWVYEQSQSYKPVFAMAAVTMVLSAIICFLLRRKLRKNIGVRYREVIYTRRVISQDLSSVDLVSTV